MDRIKNARWPFVGAIVLVTLIFGFGSATTKLAYESITPFWCLALRFGLATAVFSAFFGPRIVRQLRSVKLGAWMPAALCMAGHFITCNVAFSFTSVTTVGFLVALPVVFTPILGAIINRTRYPLAFVPFQLAVVGGLYFLCCDGGALTFGPGEALGIVASLCMAGAIVFSQRSLGEMDAVAVAGSQLAVTFALSLGFALVFEPGVNLGAVQPMAWGIIVFLALASSCLTFLLQNISLKKLSSTTVSLLLTGEPVFTALFSFALLGETLSLMGFGGAALIVVAVVAATLVEGRQQAEPVAAPATASTSVPDAVRQPAPAFASLAANAPASTLFPSAPAMGRVTRMPQYIGATRFAVDARRRWGWERDQAA